MRRGGAGAGMMVPMRRLTGTRRHFGCAQNEGNASLDRREHEARRNERAQEYHSEDDRHRPSGIPELPHPFHRLAQRNPSAALRPFCHFFSLRRAGSFPTARAIRVVRYLQGSDGVAM
jgi:hypothetical protein